MWDDETVRAMGYARIKRYVMKIVPTATQWDYLFDGFYNPTTNRVRIFIDGKRYTRPLKW